MRMRDVSPLLLIGARTRLMAAIYSTREVFVLTRFRFCLECGWKSSGRNLDGVGGIVRWVVGRSEEYNGGHNSGNEQERWNGRNGDVFVACQNRPEVTVLWPFL
ncbi:hypothetical protein K435DRAFT_222980 [Dendrothele bispora CBS 962.96]|uniref:Uncharacterized protein n=1 Tax=Dendrothele bispora (strain CBS 962.96) TaxID=1314807 RepID=A0A4S8LQT0_DENBC|nr:hypothetical protein K435DRAFT_222980 [Dendrothele bispora CBS 962.96]